MEIKSYKDKKIWFSVDTNNMIYNDMNFFVKMLKESMSLTFYQTTRKIYIEAYGDLTEDKVKEINSWMFYHPIKRLASKPEVSDYDEFKW
jgi:hypothetical protein